MTSVIMLGATYGPTRTTPTVPILRDEAFGPCADGRSAFCTGYGRDVVDPLALGDLATAFRTTILCAFCEDLREREAPAW